MLSWLIKVINNYYLLFSKVTVLSPVMRYYARRCDRRGTLVRWGVIRMFKVYGVNFNL